MKIITTGCLLLVTVLLPLTVFSQSSDDSFAVTEPSELDSLILPSVSTFSPGIQPVYVNLTHIVFYGRIALGIPEGVEVRDVEIRDARIAYFGVHVYLSTDPDTLGVWFSNYTSSLYIPPGRYHILDIMFDVPGMDCGEVKDIQWEVPPGGAPCAVFFEDFIPYNLEFDPSLNSTEVKEPLPADFDGNDRIDVEDVVNIVQFMFNERDAPVAMNVLDVDANCRIDVADLVYLIRYAFDEGPEPFCGCAD